MQSGYAIDDPRPRPLEAPYTFYLPSAERLAALAVGDQVQLIIRGVPASDKYDAERMWVEITSIDGDDMLGSLCNQPFDIPQLQAGDPIRFVRFEVIDAILMDEARARIGLVQRREYWDRCLVDAAIIEGRARVDYLYREPPEPARADDKYPDSGWRLRAPTEQVQPEDKPKYLALGAVLNRDDSWLHLIDAPVGSAFERDPASGDFRAVD